MTTRRNAARSASTSSKPDDGDELDRLLDLAGDGEKIQLLRSTRAGEPLKYVDQFDPAEMRAVGIREFTLERCGGSGDGAFRARIRRTDGTYGKSKTFSIEGEPKKYSRTSASSEAAATAAAAPATSGAESVMTKVALAFAVPFATAAAGFLAKALLDRKSDDPMKLEMLRMLREPRERGGAGMSPLDIQKLVQEAERRGMELGKELGELRAIADGGSDEGPPAANMAQVVDGAVKEFGRVMTRHMDLEEKRMVNRIPARSSAAATSTKPAAPDATPLNTDDPLVTLLGSIPKSARMFLLSAAQENEDPAVYVDLVVTKLTEQAYDQMAAQITREDFLEVLLAVVPMYQAHREWFAQLVDGLREHFTTPADDELSPQSGAADVPAAS